MSATITVPPEWQCLSSPRIPEVKVWITIDGKPLATHKKDTMNQVSVSAEIVGIEGKEFKGYEQPLVFGKVATTDDPSKADSSERAISQIGTIKIKYRRIKGVKMVTVPPSPPRPQASSSAVAATSTVSDPQILIDEKKKKAQFGLGQARPVGQSVSVGRSSGSASQTPQPPKPAPKPKTKVDYKIVDADTPFITYTFRVRSSIGIQDELFADEPIASGSGSSKRSSADLEDEEDEDEDEDLDEEALEAKLKALEEETARLKAKRAKISKPDVKPRISPAPPFDWQGSPPIDFGERIYVDFDGSTAEMVEREEVEKEKMKEIERRKNALQL
ncbi:hypothetical protein JCM5350_003723 [Sporobolomyces pararoseus]